MRLLDLFCGRWGWSKAFAARGWECVGVDLVEPPEIPQGCEFVKGNVLMMGFNKLGGIYLASQFTRALGHFDFICGSSPCEGFAVFGLKMWHPNPPHPNVGINLFQCAQNLCKRADVPYVMENVRTAQQFVGKADNHCGPFYLWGSGVPAIFPQGITKGSMLWSPRYRNMKKSQRKQEVATIPPELANCVADYAERLLEQKVAVTADRGTQFR